MCLLTIYGTDEDQEEKTNTISQQIGTNEDQKEQTNTIIIHSQPSTQPSSSCHPFFLAKEFQPPSPKIVIVYDSSRDKSIGFYSLSILAKYLHAGGAYPPLKISPHSKIVENLANLSAPILKLLSLEAPAPDQTFRLDPESKSDWDIMNLALTLSLHSITTPLDTSIHEWKMNTLLKSFGELWGHISKKGNTVEHNQVLRTVLTMIIDPCNVFEFEKYFQRRCPALATWAKKHNTSGKPVGAVITILLMFGCMEWSPPMSVLIPTLILPACWGSRKNVVDDSLCPMSPRRTGLLNKKASGNHSPSKMVRTPSLSNISGAFSSCPPSLHSQIHLGATGSEAAPPKEGSDVDDFDDEGPFNVC